MIKSNFNIFLYLYIYINIYLSNKNECNNFLFYITVLKYIQIGPHYYSKKCPN